MSARTTSSPRRSLVLCLFLLALITAAAAVPYGLLARFASPVSAQTVEPAGDPPDRSPIMYIQAGIDPLVPDGFDCSRIEELGIEKQMNLRAGAIMIGCGRAEGGSPAVSDESQEIFEAILDYGTTDVNVITGADTFPNITQSGTSIAANPDNPAQILIGYNDSRGRNQNPINISGASFSSDGGSTYTRITTAAGQSPFVNTFGYSAVLYNRPTATWFTVWLDPACGGQGLGGYKSTNPADPASWIHYCAQNGSSNDRHSAWADNNPASPFFGRMYMAWNDFNVGGGAIRSSRSTDNGLTWSAPINITTTFVRAVHLTGNAATGHLYLAATDEMGGGLTNRANRFYRSTDGGLTFGLVYTGPTFAGPGRSVSGYFATMYSSPAYWRHMGSGQSAALNGVVHYVYSSRNTGNGDPADVFYIRSSDGGLTFGAPFMLNSNVETTKAQWQPSLSVTAAGSLLAVWYDERERASASCQPSTTANPCYRMWARRSSDNGLTWLPDEPFSDVVTPLPLQPDPGIQPTFAGDWDLAFAVGDRNIAAWVDGRVPINGAPQQNVFTDRVGGPTGSPTQTATPTPTPTATPTPTPGECDEYTATAAPVGIVPGTVDIGNHCDDCMTTVALPFEFSFYGTPFSTANISSNGNLQFTSVNAAFTNACPLPTAAMDNAIFPFWDDLRTDTAGMGIFTSVSGSAPNRIFNIEWRAAYFSGSTTANFQARLYEANGRIEFVYGAMNGDGSSATVGVQRGTGTAFTSFSCNAPNITNGLQVNLICPTGSCNEYTATSATAGVVPGTVDIGNHCDDCVTNVALPFPFLFYGTPFSSANVSSNGNLQFASTNSEFTNACPLPTTTMDNAIFPFWDDLRTDTAGMGIFTSVSGSAPNRIFNIEWRAAYFSGSTTANFEARLYEANGRIEFVYGAMNGNGSSATVGVQRGTGTAFTSFSCNAPNITNGLLVALACPVVGSNISGTVLHETAPLLGPVPAVVVSGAGSPSVSTATDGSGTYVLTGFGPGAYTVTPTKPAQVFTVSNGIFSNDAALISRHVVGLITLNAAQQKAARVAGQATITAQDAGLVAQYIVGIPNAVNLSGQWKFTPVDRMYPSVTTNQTNQDYAATLMGDVSGDWMPPAMRTFSAGRSPFVWDTVTASVPRIKGMAGKPVTIPLRFDNLGGGAISSYQFTLRYDPAVIEPAAIAASLEGTMADGMNIAYYSPEPGILNLAVYSAFPASGDGVYVNLRFMVTGGIGSMSPLTITDFRFNDDRDEITTVDGRIVVGHETGFLAE